MRLRFACSVAQPNPGDVKIQELKDDTCGPDLSGSFSFTLENGDKVLRIRETTPVLTHRTWYTVRNTGDWANVAPFEVHYLVQVGDASNDRFVLFNDLTFINSGVPTINAPDDDRREISGDRNILFNDLTVANAKIPSLNNVPKPTGH